MSLAANSARATHVSQSLKTLDRDRYYASLVLPSEKREAVQSVWAMSAEIAAIRERVSEPAPGEIRLQWWVDALSGDGHGNVRQNPVADAVLDAIEQYQLPTVPLLRLCAARRFDLYQDPMPDTESFEGYAGETNSVLYQYASMVLNDGASVEPGDAAGHLGVAHAYLGHLIGFGFNASRGQIFLPMDVFAAHGVSDRDILTGQSSAGIISARAQMLDAANDHLTKAQLAVLALRKNLRPAFGQIAILQSAAKTVEHAQQMPFETPAGVADWRKLGALMFWALRLG